eukprot:Gregarina_sp_Poly_1__10167@NODE_699_length_6701_cov_39_270274_g527_i0_p1_GENE_NODE_699_length_6701_cov_39_270274_g527_i0NODE_699_length_6701_cov_39_270274_g527_i0_p1_ORF_typecomplete_len716_score87_38_NODE_699_length_6701_cov_39_270274_g527_i038646011
MLEFLTQARLLVSGSLLAEFPAGTTRDLIIKLLNNSNMRPRRFRNRAEYIATGHLIELLPKAIQLFTLETLHLRVEMLPSAGLAKALQDTIFRLQQVPRNRRGEHILWGREWEVVAEQEERDLRSYSLVSDKQLFPDCRVPRRVKANVLIPCRDLAAWRRNCFRYKVNGTFVYLHGSFMGPIKVDDPDVVRKLWCPPWKFCEFGPIVAQCGSLMFPSYSTFTRYVPDLVLAQVPGRVFSPPQSNDVYRVACKAYFGHNRPLPIFLTKGTIEENFPHLLVKWNHDVTLRNLIFQTHMEFLTIVPAILLYGSSDVFEVDMSPLEVTSLKYPNVKLEVLGDSRRMSDWGNDIGLILVSRKWEVLKLFGALGELIEAIQLLFDALYTTKVDSSLKSIRCNMFLFLPAEIKSLYAHGLASLQATVYTAGFHPAGGKSCFELPNISTWEPKARKGFTMTSLENRDLFMSTSNTLMQSPVLLSESPCQLGHLLSIIMADIAWHYLRNRNISFSHICRVESLMEQIASDRRMQHKHNGEEHKQYGSGSIPQAPRVERRIIEYYLRCIGLRRQALSLFKKQCPIFLPPLDIDLVSFFPKALQACLVTYGSPAPIIISTPPQPFAHVSPLGNLLFNQTTVRGEWVPPWNIAQGDKELDELEDEEVLSSDEIIEDWADSDGLIGAKLNKDSKPSADEIVAEIAAARKYLENTSVRLHTSQPLTLDW